LFKPSSDKTAFLSQAVAHSYKYTRVVVHINSSQESDTTYGKTLTNVSDIVFKRKLSMFSEEANTGMELIGTADDSAIITSFKIIAAKNTN
jgi:hypothetical protein